MEGNDLSNAIPQKLCFVLDGFVVRISEDDQKAAEKARRKSRWKDLAALYEVDTMMVAHLWDLVWRSPYSFDLVTFESAHEDWYEAIIGRLDRSNVPYSTLLTYGEVDHFAQGLTFMPNIIRVFHNVQSWQFKFGHRGQYVDDPQVFKVHS